MIENHLHISGFALSLVFKQRLGITRKWRVQFSSNISSRHDYRGVAMGMINLRDAFTTRDFNCTKINLFFGPRILGHEDFPSKKKIFG